MKLLTLSSLSHRAVLTALLTVASPEALADPLDCAATPVSVGTQRVLALQNGGGSVVRAKMNINIDGSGRAYAKTNAAAGALIHLCNAGEVFLADGTHYQGSESNATCSGKFMDDFRRIGEAGWKDPSVGAIRWFGILGRGSARIAGRTVNGVEPVEQAGAPGLYVSPTTLVDPSFPEDDLRRYPDPFTVPGGVVRQNATLQAAGVKIGTFGVALDVRRASASPVPFIVNDYGPRVGEGTPALARLVAGKAVKPDITRAERFVGLVDRDDVLWVFFGGAVLPPPFDAERVKTQAKAAFDAWGGEQRLQACVSATAPR